ncbi:MAG: hypothetical protein KF688_08445 [Pirellulales bacterium]|nr:hypothetical protein [Pirellulales bacterium]
MRLALVAVAATCAWQTVEPLSRAADIAAPGVDVAEPITIAADYCERWRQGIYDVYRLRGHVYLNQGLTYARGSEAVLWIAPGKSLGEPTKVIAYFESVEGAPLTVDFQRRPEDAAKGGLLGRQQGSTWFERFATTAPLKLSLPEPAPEPQIKPEIYSRGLEQFDPQRRQQLLLAQFTEFTPVPATAQQLPPGVRRFQLFPRSDLPFNLEWKPGPAGENAMVLSGGVRLLIEGVAAEGLPANLGPLGVIDLSTDRAVVFASGVSGGPGGAGLQTQDAPLEIYMEGNIEFRQGDRVVYADRMYYDVRRQIGVILNAEVLTPLPNLGGFEYPGLVRLKAAAVRQLDESRFAATNAIVTTSRLEEPSYAIGAKEIVFEDVQKTVVDPATGAPLVDPFTGDAVVDHKQVAESYGNAVYLRGIPVFYWPRVTTDLEEPSFVIDRVRLGNDNVFGTQVQVDYDAYQLFGMRNAPAGTDWGLSTDYLSDRGLGFGTDFSYNRNGFLGLDGPARGLWDAWAIRDSGVDNLGLGRRTINPEENFRFRLFGQHRQRLENGWELTAESGWISDRTFLEQYYEREWDELKSPRTGVRLKRLDDNREWALSANARVNDFFTETQELPRLDHYWLGASLLDDRLTWFEHSHVAYLDHRTASTPTDPTLASQFSLFPWEGNARGVRAATRQEFDLPVQLGVVKVVPFALGEFAHWGEDLTGNSLDRAYVHAGVRASVPMWAVFPEYRDTLFNLNGLAHKVVFDAELSYADANQNFDQLPLYDPLDDISLYEFRRRIFDGTLPPSISDPKFDPRLYAIRSGLQGWVTSPSTEMVDDLMVARLGMRNRWQTKRGGPGRQHIVDWLTLDMNVSLFPDANRDNFGQEFGLFDYDLRWHLGDRFTVVSDGAADFFGSGLATASGGIVINRPSRGNGYIGVRTINGPINSNVLLGSYNYRLSEKWISSASATFDLSTAGNIGQTLALTRIGESMLFTMGFNVDNSKNNVGVSFLLEPRFLPNLRLTRETGIDVPPAGAFGLE